MMACSIGYEAKPLPAPVGVDILEVDRRAAQFVLADNWSIASIWR
jgi:hypothetical protein